VHFRADFSDLAAAIWVVASPGLVTADPADLPYRNLRPGVRLRPLGPARQL
jgi:microcystin degradation protein MlrC